MNNDEVSVKVIYSEFNNKGLGFFSNKVSRQREKLTNILTEINRLVYELTKNYWSGYRANKFIEKWNGIKSEIEGICEDVIEAYIDAFYDIIDTYSTIDGMQIDFIEYYDSKFSDKVHCYYGVMKSNEWVLNFENYEVANRIIIEIEKKFNDIKVVFSTLYKNISNAEWTGVARNSFIAKIDEITSQINSCIDNKYVEMKNEFDEAVKQYSEIH